MSAQAFVAAARTFVGTRWRHRGRNRRGIDCVGLLVLSAKATGFPFEDASHYGRDPWEDRLRSELKKRLGEPVGDASAAIPGDIALIVWFAGQPSHVGIIGDGRNGEITLIHCENLHGCVEHSLDGHYIDCIVEVYRPWPVKFFP